MILMVDDEKRWVSGYKDALEYSGYTCELIDNVDDFGIFIDDEDKLAAIDLVILDIMMAPRKRYSDEDTEDGMNTGNFVADDLKQRRPDIPIVVLTNKDRDISGERVAKLCDHYLLKKEIVPKALVDIISEMLGKDRR
jgi:CheY-like chemotaxis protein